MSVRIAQYETGARVLKADMLTKIADVLQCNYKALDDYSLGSAEDIIETLFWLRKVPLQLLESISRNIRLPAIFSVFQS